MQVRRLGDEERPWLEAHLTRAWGARHVVSRGRSQDAACLPAFVCVDGDDVIGVATFCISGGECELVTIDALRERAGVGSAFSNPSRPLTNGIRVSLVPQLRAMDRSPE